ncbi:LytR/AlgR family response regulator transcription factor [Fervidobacterium thailandense]|uniref:Response regulator transcription factor n=1 Tax=Fervidobacterium thailandense TaxID=1008305 RepID=A0A1E3G3P9_9BACT|nr:LytTR family DNA-binding domain-containing protein [Fervidobacterium thailandense]ODN30829.1 hypothetical protein A4H02_02875 [Fervidobacterium thailandense]
MSRVLRCVIVEDEKLQALVLEKLLKELGVKVESIAMNAREAVEVINSVKPDVVFLDINLGDADGFYVLEQVSHKPYVVFTTAYSEYALKAFEVYAIDYIVKPVTRERIAKTIERLRNLLEKSDESFEERLQEQVRRALERLREEFFGLKRPRFSVEIGDEVVFLDPSDILYIEAFEHGARIATKSAEYISKTPLKELEEQLSSEGLGQFVRVHRSYLVNMDHVRKISRNYFGTVALVLSNDKTIPVGRSYRKVLDEYFS